MSSTHFVSVRSTLCNISRDISGKFARARNSKEKYPRPEEIVRRAREGHDSNEETFADLYLDDLLWAQAIASDHRLKGRDREVIEPLVELLNRGIYDREEKEENCRSEERSMRFSAVCDSLLLQYCCSLRELVGLALTLVLER